MPNSTFVESTCNACREPLVIELQNTGTANPNLINPEGFNLDVHITCFGRYAYFIVKEQGEAHPEYSNVMRLIAQLMQGYPKTKESKLLDLGMLLRRIFITPEGYEMSFMETELLSLLCKDDGVREGMTDLDKSIVKDLLKPVHLDLNLGPFVAEQTSGCPNFSGNLPDEEIKKIKESLKLPSGKPSHTFP